MLPRAQKPPVRTLELPAAFEDLSGVIAGDLRVIVSSLADRATDRLLLTHKQRHQLERSLWNRLSTALNDELAPLAPEHR